MYIEEKLCQLSVLQSGVIAELGGGGAWQHGDGVGVGSTRAGCVPSIPPELTAEPQLQSTEGEDRVCMLSV